MLYSLATLDDMDHDASLLITLFIIFQK